MEEPIRGAAAERERENEDAIAQVCFKAHRIELFRLPRNVDLGGSRTVIVEAERGVDLGHLVRADAGRLQQHPGNDLRAILRAATADEIRHLEKLRREDEEALRVCRERVDTFGLPMRTVDAEFQFDGNRVTFFFVAEGRVDFRSLVRDLARIFRTRIELRQIHQREASRRQGGIGPCGRGLCCSSFLQGFEPVTLKMAKRQNLTLTPVRISGMCGRLLCCLTYDPEGGGCGGCHIAEDDA